MNLLSLIVYGSLRLYKYSTKKAHYIKWNKKIRNLLNAKKTDKLTTGQIRAIRSYYNKFNINRINTSWHRFYSLGNGGFSVEYVPESIFYVDIEPKLNASEFATALSDKNLLERLLDKVKQPETIIRNMNGLYYHEERLLTLHEAIGICKGKGELIIKPSIDSGGGKNVRLVICVDGHENNKSKNIEQLFSSYKKDFLVQRKVRQHELMGHFNGTSLNTFRIMTYLTDNEVIFISTIVRMGMKGSVTDNSSGGGISCGVNEDGTLKEFGYKFSGERFAETSEDIPFAKIRLPFMPKVYDTSKKLHKSIPYFKIISWDLAIDESGDVVLIEYNVRGQDITFHQMNNGPVLSILLEQLNS